jgi:hypothetical protein
MTFDEFRRRIRGRASNDNGDVLDCGLTAGINDPAKLPRDIRPLVARMTSRKKADANRKNAKKSTGPQSKRGKALTRFNALKSGMFAAQRLIAGEDELEYEQLAQRVGAELKPATIMESLLTDQIIADMWRLKRIEGAEPIYFEQVRHAMLTRLLRSMSDNDLGFTFNEFELTMRLEDGDASLRGHGKLEPSVSRMPEGGSSKSRSAAHYGPRYPDDSTSFFQQELARVDRPEMIVLEGVAPPDKELPFSHIDRIRRSLVRDIMQKYLSLCELQNYRAVTASPQTSRE